MKGNSSARAEQDIPAWDVRRNTHLCGYKNSSQTQTSRRDRDRQGKRHRERDTRIEREREKREISRTYGASHMSRTRAAYL